MGRGSLIRFAHTDLKICATQVEVGGVGADDGNEAGRDVGLSFALLTKT